jgi:oxygen-independent coproporphyrinogen-3 oxidase
MKPLEFYESISWAEKTPYFYPPWKYLSNLETNRIEGHERFISSIKSINKEINLYFHFPLCTSKCPFCFYYGEEWNNLKKTQNISSDLFNFKTNYIQMMLKELNLWLNNIKIFRNGGSNGDINIKNLYIGGGTPSYWFDNNNDISEFIDSLKSRININEIKEITFEISPKIVNFEVIEYLKKNFNDKLRLSIGVQSFNENSLRIIRDLKNSEIESYLKNTIDIINYAQRNNIYYNLDIMWGLRENNVKTELNKIKEKVDKYNWKIPQYTFYHIWSPNDLKREKKYRESLEKSYESIISQRKDIFNKLSEWGYESNILIEYFTKKDEAKNSYNLEEMEDFDYIGCGLTAHGKIGNLVYSNDSGYSRYEQYLNNEFLPLEKFYFIDDAEDIKNRRAYLNLRIPRKTYDLKQLKQLFGEKSSEIISTYFERINNDKYKLNDEGKYRLPEIMLSKIGEIVKKKDAWQKKEVYDLCEKVERFIEADKEVREEKITYILDILSLDLFILLVLFHLVWVSEG